MVNSDVEDGATQRFVVGADGTPMDYTEMRALYETMEDYAEDMERAMNTDEADAKEKEIQAFQSVCNFLIKIVSFRSRSSSRSLHLVHTPDSRANRCSTISAAI